METGHDTIAAISTPRGSGGIAVIRISGPGALEAISRCFRTARKDFPAGARDFSLGRVFLPSGGFVDEAVCIVMRGPRSYTGEDVAELQCHGGTAAARSVLSAALQSGCRQARAGEFTRRAFMNGKISLLKAESVLAMIKARTEAARQVASSMLSGRAEGQAVRAKELVSGILARMEAQLDWPDEMKDEGSWNTAGEIDEAAARIGGMIDEAGKGRLLTEGIKVAIIGRPNMGKSSLLNRLLGMDRAIVSELPGTTRDTVEETANVEGIPIRFADTAGIGAFEDPVVAAGVARAKQAASSSSVIVYVCAFPDGLSDEDVEELGRIKGKSVIVAFNKEDLQDEGGSQLASLPRRGFDPMGYRSVRVSAKTGRGMEDLRAAIANEACNITDFEGAEGPYARWLYCLEGCRERLSSAGRALSSGMPTEAVCLDLREALCSLGEFTGDTTADDVVGMVFDKFCIGK